MFSDKNGPLLEGTMPSAEMNTTLERNLGLIRSLASQPQESKLPLGAVRQSSVHIETYV